MPHRLGEVGVETLYLAAAEEARIGGDFYEAVDTPYGVRVQLGDVRGKGLPTVGVASAVTNSFREAAYDEPDLARLARHLDTSISRYGGVLALTSPEAAEGFATAVLAQIPHGSHRVALVNCGHPPPLLLRGGGARALDPSRLSPPLNTARLIGGGYTADTVPLADGDQLPFYTDGVTETRDRAGRLFPLLGWVAGQDAVPARRLLGLLHEQLPRFSGGGLDDDIAALVVRRDARPPDVSVPSGATAEV